LTRLELSDTRPANRPDALLLVDSGTPEISLEVAQLPAAQRSARWTILRPIDLTVSHGVNFTAEVLAEMVAGYDPAIETGTLNFDHSWGGRAHGRLRAPRIEADGSLSVEVYYLSDEAVQGIQDGGWFRLSSEIAFAHPATGGYYLRGLALLGQRAPGCWGLPPISLSAAHQPAAAAADKEGIMPTDPTGATSPDPGAVALAAQQEAVRLRAELAETRLSVAQLKVSADLQQINGITLAMRTAGLEALALSLRMLEGTTVQLAADKQVAPYEVLLSVLRALPDLSKALGGDVADAANAADATAAELSAGDQAILASAGIDAKRAAELVARYGGAN
jgi:hypothetical protein